MRVCVRRSVMRGWVGRLRSLCRGRSRAGAGSICHCWMKRAGRTGWRIFWRRIARGTLTSGVHPLCALICTVLRPGRRRSPTPLPTLLLDGWSLPVLVRELFTLYAHKGDCAVLPRVTPYRDYLAWIAAQDRAAAVSAWRAALAGLDQATRVAPPDRARKPVAPERITVA